MTFPVFACSFLHFWRLLRQSGLALLDFPFFSCRGHCFPINPTNDCQWGLILGGKTPMWFDHSSSTIINEQESIRFFNLLPMCWSVPPHPSLHHHHHHHPPPTTYFHLASPREMDIIVQVAAHSARSSSLPTLHWEVQTV